MKVRKSVEIAHADGIRFGSCVHGFSFLKLKNSELQIYNIVMINITTNSDIFLTNAHRM